jgi:hypothetical protein
MHVRRVEEHACKARSRECRSSSSHLTFHRICMQRKDECMGKVVDLLHSTSTFCRAGMQNTPPCPPSLSPSLPLPTWHRHAFTTPIFELPSWTCPTSAVITTPSTPSITSNGWLRARVPPHVAGRRRQAREDTCAARPSPSASCISKRGSRQRRSARWQAEGRRALERGYLDGRTACHGEALECASVSCNGSAIPIEFHAELSRVMQADALIWGYWAGCCKVLES